MHALLFCPGRDTPSYLGQVWVPPGRDLGPVTGIPPKKDMESVEVLWDGDGVPPRKDMGPVETLWDGDGVPPPPHHQYGQTD